MTRRLLSHAHALTPRSFSLYTTGAELRAAHLSGHRSVPAEMSPDRGQQRAPSSKNRPGPPLLFRSALAPLTAVRDSSAVTPRVALQRHATGAGAA